MNAEDRTAREDYDGDSGGSAAGSAAPCSGGGGRGGQSQSRQQRQQDTTSSSKQSRSRSGPSRIIRRRRPVAVLLPIPPRGRRLPRSGPVIATSSSGRSIRCGENEGCYGCSAGVGACDKESVRYISSSSSSSSSRREASQTGDQPLRQKDFFGCNRTEKSIEGSRGTRFVGMAPLSWSQSQGCAQRYGRGSVMYIMTQQQRRDDADLFSSRGVDPGNFQTCYLVQNYKYSHALRQQGNGLDSEDEDEAILELAMRVLDGYDIVVILEDMDVDCRMRFITSSSSVK